MLHNLKSNSMRYLGLFGANIDKNNLRKLLLGRRFANNANILVKCWHCGNEHLSADILFKCIKCQSLLELPNEVDHFQLLNVEKQFDIDAKIVTKQFRQIQNILHPDKFSNSSEKEQHLSAEWSSLVNKAYKMLMSPIQRAEYLLRSQNVNIPEGNTISNTQFLTAMMERNEEVDDADNREQLTKLLVAVQKDNLICVDKLGTALSTNNLNEAKELLIVLRYWLSLENSIKEKANRIGIVL